MKRTAYENYDFAQDAIRLKELAGTPDEFTVLFRPFWDKDDDSSSGGDILRQTKCLRGMGETFSKLPVLQCLNLSEDKMKRVGLHKYRFTGGPKNAHVPFHVRMAELLHVLPLELKKSSELAGHNVGIDMGAAGSEDASDEAGLRRDYELVITNLGALFLLFTPDVPAARAFTEDDLASAGTSLAGAISDPGTCAAIFRVLDHLCGREAPDDSDDYAADSERQAETKRLWRRFRQDNCKPAKRQYKLTNPLCTVGYGSQASLAAVRADHSEMESQREAVARKQSSATGQKEVFDARLRTIFKAAAPPPASEFDGETHINRQLTIISNVPACGRSHS
jgi:hypothetical protein